MLTVIREYILNITNIQKISTLEIFPVFTKLYPSRYVEIYILLESNILPYYLNKNEKRPKKKHVRITF
jgi:hypothetical protein